MYVCRRVWKASPSPNRPERRGGALSRERALLEVAMESTGRAIPSAPLQPRDRGYKHGSFSMSSADLDEKRRQLEEQGEKETVEYLDKVKQKREETKEKKKKDEEKPKEGGNDELDPMETD